MKYGHRQDYKDLLSLARRSGSTSRVFCSSTDRGGVVVTVKTPVCSIRIWAMDDEDAFEAARCALIECGANF